MSLALTVLAAVALWMATTILAAVVLGRRLEGRGGIDRNRFGDVIDGQPTQEDP